MNPDINALPLGPAQASSFNAVMGAGVGQRSLDDTSVVLDGSGGRALRTSLQRGTIHSIPSGQTNGAAMLIPFEPVNSACISYDVRFSAGFEWAGGGKLPGLQGVLPGSGVSPGGGEDVSDKAWSGRLMWLGPSAFSFAGPSNMAVSYMYHYGQPHTYGDNVPWNEPFVSGPWQSIKVCYTLNTPGSSNGVLDAYLNGVNVLHDTSYVYRSRSGVKIDGLAWSVFRGGNTLFPWASSSDSTIDIRKVLITGS